MTQPLPDEIARLCLDAYASLPSKGKPRLRSNGQPEWTVLAAFVLVDAQGSSQVISLGTGVKCLPATRLPQHGDVLHDSHAEIIARRGFMLWLYNEISDKESAFLRPSLRDETVLELRSEFQLHVYISTLPCGDASTLYLAKMQDPTVAATFVREDVILSSNALTRGRQGFSHIGALRTKPARADAISTESLSCSDKLATYSILGVQGALLSRRLAPIYIASYNIGGVPTQLRNDLHQECQRALFGRLGMLEGLPEPFKQTPPSVVFADLMFPFSKEAVSSANIAALVVSAAESLSWISGLGSEVISNGIKQGSAVVRDGQQKASARSRFSRLDLFQRYSANDATATQSYRATKQGAVAYQKAKRILRGTTQSPLAAWLISAPDLQNFDVGGQVKNAQASKCKDA